MGRDFLLRCTGSRPTVENEDVFAKIEISGRDVDPIVAFGRVTLAPIVSGYRSGSYFHEASFLALLVPNCAYGLIDEGF